MIGTILLLLWLGRYAFGTPRPMHRRLAPWLTTTFGALLLLYGTIGLVAMVAGAGSVRPLALLGVAATFIVGGLQLWEAQKVRAWRATQRSAPFAPRLDKPAPPRAVSTAGRGPGAGDERLAAAPEPAGTGPVGEASAWRIDDLFPPLPPDH